MAVRRTLDLSEGMTSLPRGRHRVSADKVVASQRGRILQAMTEVVSEKGYAATTVADVIGRAGVSRNPFYQLFEDKEDCYLAAYKRTAGQLYDMVTAAAASEDHWLERLRCSLRTYLGAYAASPAFARAFSVEIGGAGARVAEHRRSVLGRYVELLQAIALDIRSERPELPPLSDELLLAVVGGADELVVDAVRRGRATRLGELEQTLLTLYLAVLLSPADARDLLVG